MSLDPEINPDIPAMIGASAAVTLTGLPFAGPIGAARVGYINDTYQINPAVSTLGNSALDMVVAGTADSVLMVESEAAELSEDVMLGAVTHAHKEMQVVVDHINQLAKQVGVTPVDWKAAEKDNALWSKVEAAATKPLTDAYSVVDKIQRRDALSKTRADLVSQLSDEETSESSVLQALDSIESNTLRNAILSEGRRVDGRALDGNTRYTDRKPMFCHARMDPLCLPVVKPRLWSLPPSVRIAMRRSLTRLKGNTVILYVALQLPSLLCRRNGSCRYSQTQGDRSRSLGKTRYSRCSAQPGRVPLCPAGRIGNHRI